MSDNDRRDNVDAGAVLAKLLDVLQKRDRNAELNAYTCAPGTIAKYDPTTELAEVAYGFLAVQDRDPLPDVPDAPVVLPDVRVMFSKTLTTYETDPITPGCTGALFFTDRALIMWLQGLGEPVDPVDGRAHDQADAFFVPGLSTITNGKIPGGHDMTGKVIESPLIKLGALALEALAKVEALENALSLACTSVVGGLPNGTIIPGDGGATAFASFALALQGSLPNGIPPALIPLSTLCGTVKVRGE